MKVYQDFSLRPLLKSNLCKLIKNTQMLKLSLEAFFNYFKLPQNITLITSIIW